MFKRIIVGLDGSDHARKALGIATTLAKADKASMVLVHAMSNAPLTNGERRMAQMEYGMKELGERPAVTSVVEAEANVKSGTPVVEQRSMDAGLRVRSEMAGALLEDARREVMQQGVTDVEMRAESGDPAQVVLQIAKEEKADLIVLGSRGHSELEGLVFGSTSHKVTHVAPCSCLTVT